MIGTIDVTVQAARPDLPLPPVRAFVGSPSSVRVRNVPRRIGEWDITRVVVTANYPDSTTEMAECVLTGGVWVGTVRGCSTPGTSLSGFVVTADGVDEHGATVSGYILGVGDVVVLTREESATPGVITFKGDKGDKGDPGDVQSVNGKVGAVSLVANDVGAYSKEETDATVSRLDADIAEASSAAAAALTKAGNAQTAADVAQSSADAAHRAASVASDKADAVYAELANKLDKTAVVAPSASATAGQAADAKAVNDALAGKVGSFESVGGASATVENGVAKLSDFFTWSNSLLTATIDARLPYTLYAVPSTGILKDRAINTTSLASVTVPDNFTDLLIRASVASSLSVTMPAAITTKYGDTFPGAAGEYLITITKTGAAEAYVRTIKLEEVA